MFFVFVECIYKPYVFSHSVATSSAECNHCSPPSSLVCGQLLTICGIAWHLPQGHMLVAARLHFFRQDTHCTVGLVNYYISSNDEVSKSNLSIRREMRGATNCTTSGCYLLASETRSHSQQRPQTESSKLSSLMNSS